MSNSTTTSSGGIGGFGYACILTIVFIVLKAFNVIDLDWIWVFSPIWITVALVIACLIIIGIIALIAAIILSLK